MTTYGSSFVSRVVLVILALGLISVSANAEDLDLTVFGGIQHAGKLTFESAPGNASNLIKNFDPKTFGVFGARFSHGKVIGGEHSFAYAPNFLDSESKGLLYHSNFLVQAPLPVVKPYGTAGIGVVHSWGDSLSSFGTKFAFNYGGGVKVITGPIGVNMDVRGYAVPKIKVVGFSNSDRMDFIQVTAGVVFHF